MESDSVLVLKAYTIMGIMTTLKYLCIRSLEHNIDGKPKTFWHTLYDIHYIVKQTESRDLVMTNCGIQNKKSEILSQIIFIEKSIE